LGEEGRNAFARLVSHFVFQDRYGRPGRGNDKGKVEALVKYARRSLLTPVPSASSFADLNADLERQCLARLSEDCDPRHFLALIERKSGALDQAAPLQGWELPPAFAEIWPGHHRPGRPTGQRCHRRNRTEPRSSDQPNRLGREAAPSLRRYGGALASRLRSSAAGRKLRRPAGRKSGRR
jgi:hypothetical protein